MAVRMGQWKALRLNMHQGNAEWQLFDLETDPMETQNVAAEHPELIGKVEQIVSEAHIPASNPRWRYAALGEEP